VVSVRFVVVFRQDHIEPPDQLRDDLVEVVLPTDPVAGGPTD
jgi:hypothetical protein